MRKRRVNPNYNPLNKEVTTNFIFNVSTTAGGKTKQNAAATQATSTNAFRGIDHAVLFTYKQTDGGGQPADGKILAADANADKTFDLAEVCSANTLSSTDSRRVLEMSLPLNTNTLLFYGKAVNNAETYDGYTREECYGHLDAYTINATAGSTVFQLGKRLQDKDKFYTEEKLLAGIMSLIMNSNLAGSNHTAIVSTEKPNNNTNVKPYKFDIAADAYGNYYWSDYAGDKSPFITTHDLWPLEQKLGRAYTQMTTINAAGGELRAASGEALIRTITDLWTVINEVRCAEPLNEAETIAKFLAARIYERIDSYFDASTKPTDGSPITGVDFRALTGTSGIVAKFNADLADKPANSANTDWPTASELAALGEVDLNTFPYRYNLPRGATHMAFDSTKKVFYYPQTFNTSGMGGIMAGGSFNAESYYYPAELMYFGNSPVRTTSKDAAVSSYPNGSGTADGQWNGTWSADWSGSHVLASTRGVAMKYDINYGTALLKTQVKYAVGTLKDNNRAVQAYFEGLDLTNTTAPEVIAFTEQDKDINVTDASFKLTGIIIGGQSQNVGWDYLPCNVPGTTSAKYGFIYDKAIPSGAQAIPANTSSKSSPNYTMVFDNYNPGASATAQDKVYVALEFQNNSGSDFYGNFNLIRDGGYFYLIAELDPANPSSDPTWPTTGYVLPPYKADGTSNQVKRIFMQDFMTDVTFTFGVNSLKHAYLTVPDLRSGSVTLGLSVDVNWSTGMVFDDVILGGN